MAIVFDGDNLLITLDTPVAGVLNQTWEEVYDEHKQWFLQGENSRFPSAFTVSGGEDITDVTIAGQYYFLRNDLGWRIRTTDEDQDVFWSGNGIPTDLTLPIVTGRAGRTIGHFGLQPLVTGIEGLADVHGQVERSIYIDTSALAVGNGYQQTPYNNLTTAIDDAEANNIKNLVILDDITIDRQLRNFVLRGIGSPTVDGNSQNLDKSEFENLKLTGDILTGSSIKASNCELLNGLTGLAGDFSFCGFGGTITLDAGSITRFTDCASTVAGLGRPTLDVNGGGCMVSNRSYRGGLTVTGADNAADEITISMAQGRLQLAAGNTDGTISCRGVTDFDDQSAGSTVETSGLVDEIIFGRLIETGYTFEQIMKILAAHAAGDVPEPVAGAYTVRDINDVKPRITGVQTANGGRNVTAVDGT